jgi:hypothetical protein
MTSAGGKTILAVIILLIPLHQRPQQEPRHQYQQDTGHQAEGGVETEPAVPTEIGVRVNY